MRRKEKEKEREKKEWNRLAEVMKEERRDLEKKKERERSDRI